MAKAFRVQTVPQRAIGLGLASAILVSWASVHLYGVFFAPFDSLSLGASIGLGLGIIVLQCWLNVGLFIIAHDCMHGSLAPGWKRLNTAIGTLSLAVYAGFSYGKLLPAHHQHHAAPGTADDPDFSVTHATSLPLWYIEFVRRYFGLREFAVLTVILTAYITLLGVPLERMLLFWAILICFILIS